MNGQSSKPPTKPKLQTGDNSNSSEIQPRVNEEAQTNELQSVVKLISQVID